MPLTRNFKGPCSCARLTAGTESDGAGISALMTAQAAVAVGVVRKRSSQNRCVPPHPRLLVSTATVIGNCELRAAKG